MDVKVKDTAPQMTANGPLTTTVNNTALASAESVLGEEGVLESETATVTESRPESAPGVSEETAKPITAPRPAPTTTPRPAPTTPKERLALDVLQSAEVDNPELPPALPNLR